MPSFKSFTAVASLLASASAFALPQGSYGGPPKKALYFLQNNPAGNSLVALDVSNGQAANPVRISTGGKGSAIFNTTTGQPMGPDSLMSQGSVATGDDYVFTVNPGSNTLAIFKIDTANPTHLTQVGQPVDTLGDFPVSVAYDTCYKKLCVLNGGAKNNVACWTMDQEQLRPDGGARSLGLSLATPPTAGSSTVSQVSFAPDSNAVFVTVKGPSTPAGPGSIYIFPVQNGNVAEQPVKSSIADIPSDFGFAFGEEGYNILVSDPTYGGSVVDVDPQSLQTTEVKHTNSSLKASCWAAYSSVTKYGYVFDAGLPQFAAFDFKTGDLKEVIQIDAAFKGAFDTVIDGAVAYFLAASPSVGAFDVQQKKTVQNLDLSSAPGIDNRTFWEGLAMWSSH